MSKGAFGLMKMAFNLVLVAAVIVGAYIGYLKFFAKDQALAKKKQAILKHVDAKAWQEALDEMDKYKEDEALKAFIKDQRFVCYKALAHEENDKGIKDEAKASKLKRSDPSKSAEYKKRAGKHYRRALNCLDEAEKRGQLLYVDVMMRAPAYRFIGEDKKARTWMTRQKDYPKE